MRENELQPRAVSELENNLFKATDFASVKQALTYLAGIYTNTDPGAAALFLALATKE